MTPPAVPAAAPGWQGGPGAAQPAAPSIPRNPPVLNDAAALDGGVETGQPVRTPLGRLRLRPHCPSDVPGLLEQYTDPVTQRWTDVPVPCTPADAEQLVLRSAPRDWRDGRVLRWAVEVEGRFAGTFALRPDAGAAVLTFGLAPWARGHGVAACGLRLLLPWAFAEVGVDAVHWTAPVGNWAARRVVWALGFRLDGTVRSGTTLRGARVDAWVASLLPGEVTRLGPREAWLDVPRLSGPGVVLRRHHGGDATRIVQACAHPGTQRWLPQLPSPYTLADALAYVSTREEEHASGRGLSWSVADPDDDRLLANIALMGLAAPGRTAEIGYWAHPQERGRGVVTRAVQLVARHALLPRDVGGLGLDRLALRAAAGNRASQRVAERAGFTRTGLERRGERLRNGSTEHFLLYDLLPDELDR